MTPIGEGFIGQCPPTPNSERVDVAGDPTNPFQNIDPDVRSRLRTILFEPEFQGVGYSAFLNRACELAEAEILIQRTEKALGR